MIKTEKLTIKTEMCGSLVLYFLRLFKILQFLNLILW